MSRAQGMGEGFVSTVNKGRATVDLYFFWVRDVTPTPTRLGPGNTITIGH